MSTIVEGEEPFLHKCEHEAGQYEDGDLALSGCRKNLGFFHRHNYLYTIFCIVIGGAISFLLSSTFSDVKTMTPRRPHLSTGLDPHPQTKEEVLENGYFCGHTPEQARMNGCWFDLILYSWVPAQCYDEELQAEFRTGDYQWFKEREAINEVSTEIAGQGIENELWLNWDWHIWHCRYIFLQMTRVLSNSSMGIPGRLMDPKHTEHCVNTLTREEYYPLKEIGTVLYLNYSTCYSRA